MATRLSKKERKNSLVRIMSKVINELASPLVLYSNYRRDLSEGKRNIKLDYLKERAGLVYKRRLDNYEQKLEKKLIEPEKTEKLKQKLEKKLIEPEKTEKIFRRDGIKYVREHYDWEEEKRQAKAIGKRTKIISNWVKTFAQKEWEKEKEIMRERAEKFRQKKDELIQGKKEKLFLEFNKFKKNINQIYNQLSNLDPNKNPNYTNNLQWQRDKLSKNINKIAGKLRRLDYPI